MNNIMPCGECSHRKICKFEPEIQTLASAIMSLYIPEFLDVDVIKCHHFQTITRRQDGVRGLEV